MGVNSLPKTVTRQRRDCDLNPGPSAPESSTLTTRLPSIPLEKWPRRTGHIVSLPSSYYKLLLVGQELFTTCWPLLRSSWYSRASNSSRNCCNSCRNDSIYCKRSDLHDSITTGATTNTSSYINDNTVWYLVALQPAEMRMVRRMCDVKVENIIQVRSWVFVHAAAHCWVMCIIGRVIRNRWHKIGTTAKQAAMIWACVAKRRWRLGEEMYGVWSRGSQINMKTKEDPDRGYGKGLSST